MSTMCRRQLLIVIVPSIVNLITIYNHDLKNKKTSNLERRPKNNNKFIKVIDKNWPKIGPKTNIELFNYYQNYKLASNVQ